MRYWWLVNVAELARLQRRVTDGIAGCARDNEALAGIVPGSIATFAARVHAGVTRPKVQVPRIDRYYTIAREKLSEMVTALMWPEMPGREDHGQEWTRVFLDLRPPLSHPDMGGVAVALEGLKFVRDEVKRHLDQVTPGEDRWLHDLYVALNDLLSKNKLYAAQQQGGDPAMARYTEWRTEVTGLVHRIIELSSPRILAPTRPTGP
jgi:hypothetical protein